MYMPRTKRILSFWKKAFLPITHVTSKVQTPNLIMPFFFFFFFYLPFITRIFDRANSCLNFCSPFPIEASNRISFFFSFWMTVVIVLGISGLLINFGFKIYKLFSSQHENDLSFFGGEGESESVNYSLFSKAIPDSEVCKTLSSLIYQNRH